MEIKPIRSEADYQAALKEIKNLMESQPGTPEGDRMEVLVTLVEAYEAKHFPIPEPDDPVEVLEYYMESRGLNRSDLIAYLGSKERVSEVLNRKRGLSLEMIRRLHRGLGIPADLIVGKHTHNPTRTHPARIAPASPKGTKSQVRAVNSGRR
ncbi:MAG: DNA-binding protein [Chloroflexi bacterium GWB2_54_36]|nr:MAG: DNA-binding protein [Chloroflexi bacterium GWB2_54_36]